MSNSVAHTSFQHTSVTADTGGLYDTPAGWTDRDQLLEHLGRKALHGCRGRNFDHAFMKTRDGQRKPRLYRTDGDYEGLSRCEYVKLTHPQCVSVIVIDIDYPGQSGGHPRNLNERVKAGFKVLTARNIGPSWVGINPLTGKAQALWLIDPVYAAPGSPSRHMGLVKICSDLLSRIVYGDQFFSHGFSRSPFYRGKKEGAYRWYPQHKRVNRVGDLVRQLREITGDNEPEVKKQQFSSGRELIEAVKARREQAEAFKALASQVEDLETVERLDRQDPELIDGVRVLWLSTVRAARDETAFRHALKTGYRLRSAGQRMTDAKIIDAYEHAYKVAQRVGADGREEEMPSMRNRQTMARRVRAYVLGGKVDSTGSFTSSPGASSRERKALATMGRKGGKKAAQRWKDRSSAYAQTELNRLARTHSANRSKGRSTRGSIEKIINDSFIQTGRILTRKEIMIETGLSESTVKRHLRELRRENLLPA